MLEELLKALIRNSTSEWPFSHFTEHDSRILINWTRPCGHSAHLWLEVKDVTGNLDELAVKSLKEAARKWEWSTQVILDCACFAHKPDDLFTPDWLIEANKLADDGNDHKALDIVYKEINNWLCSGEFELCNCLLKHLNPDKLNIDISLGLLTITLAASHLLPARQAFFLKFRKYLHYWNEDTHELLSGLEGDIMNLKDLVKDRNVNFEYYRDGELWYATGCGFKFPVPISDTGTGVFKAVDKAILYMRYIRKHLEKIQEARELQV